MFKCVFIALLVVSLSGIEGTLQAQEDTPTFKFSDTKVPVGSQIIRRNITFTGACKQDLSKGTKTLDSLFTFMKSNADIKIEIRVHLGKAPNPECHGNMSLYQAERLKSYLEKKGIDKSRITTKGFGMSDPIKPVTEKGAEKLNQRVVFIVTYNKF